MDKFIGIFILHIQSILKYKYFDREVLVQVRISKHLFLIHLLKYLFLVLIYLKYYKDNFKLYLSITEKCFVHKIVFFSFGC